MQQLAALPSPWWALLLVPIGLLAWRRPTWLTPWFFLAGVVWVTLRAGAILQDELPSDLEGRDLLVQGHVADIPQFTDYGLRFLFDVSTARLNDRSVRVPRRVQLNLRSYNNADSAMPARLRAGEAWRFMVRLKRPRGFQNPGGFDYEAYLFRQRIRARGYVRTRHEPARLAGQVPGFARAAGYAIARARQDIGDHIRRLLPGNAYAGIITALVNGDRRSISDDQWLVLRRTGTLHLVAISGLHISLIAGLAYFLGRYLWSVPGTTVLRLPAPAFGALCALAAAVLYAALAGFVIPTQRALIMLAVAMSGVLLRRRFASTQLLAVALLLVLVHDPLAVMATGFWLSFAAVAIIVFAVNDTSGARSLWRKWGYLQWAIALGMLPLMLLLFQQVSLVAPIANTLAVPMFSFLVVPLSLAGIAAQATLPQALAGVLFQSAAWLLDLLWQVLGLLSQWEYGQWTQHRPPWWAVACGAIGVALLLAPRGTPARWVGAVWLLPLFLVRPPGPQPGEVWFSLLDVGQGLAAVVRTQHHVLVYDTGPRFSATFDTGAAVVVPYLRANGVARVDTLLLSHGDNDHVGGARSVLRAYPASTVLSNVQLEGITPQPCRAGRSWRDGEVEFEVLSPPEDIESVSAIALEEVRSQAGARRRRRRARGNDLSCVLRVRSPYGNILLPGDIEALAEHALIERYGSGLASTVLVVPHHGSKTSSTTPFVAAVRPTHALFPVGYRNRYRHPHRDVVARYGEADAARYDSAAHGAIEVRLGAQGITLNVYRETHQRYWFTP